MMTAPHILASYRPFIDPIDHLFDAHRWWFLFLIPLALGVSVAYKAVRVVDMATYWRQVAAMTVQIVLSIIALGAIFFVFIQYVLPLIAPR